MKVNWRLFLGSLCMLMFVGMRWKSGSIEDALGLGLGIVGLCALIVSFFFGRERGSEDKR